MSDRNEYYGCGNGGADIWEKKVAGECSATGTASSLSAVDLYDECTTALHLQQTVGSTHEMYASVALHALFSLITSADADSKGSKT